MAFEQGYINRRTSLPRLQSLNLSKRINKKRHFPPFLLLRMDIDHSNAAKRFSRPARQDVFTQWHLFVYLFNDYLGLGGKNMTACTESMVYCRYGPIFSGAVSFSCKTFKLVRRVEVSRCHPWQKTSLLTVAVMCSTRLYNFKSLIRRYLYRKDLFRARKDTASIQGVYFIAFYWRLKISMNE